MTLAWSCENHWLAIVIAIAIAKRVIAMHAMAIAKRAKRAKHLIMASAMHEIEMHAIDIDTQGWQPMQR